MGKLIVIEGLDGSGKSTQINFLKSYLQQKEIKLKQIKLPDYDDPSSTLVKMYLHGDFGKNADDVNAFAASSFFTVDRFASFKRHWEKEFNDGHVIIADRYTTSNAVHQTCKLDKSLWDQYLYWLYDYEFNLVKIPKPDLVIYLDMAPEISQKLMSLRYDGNENKKDIHEKDLQYLESCRTAALYSANKLNWHIINCFEGNEPISRDRIFSKIKDVVDRVLDLNEN